jgi:hypothetical protein
MPIARWKDLCVDVVDPGVMGPFWAETLGLQSKRLDDGDVLLEGPTPEQRVWLNAVAEPVTAKQRVHLDVHAESSDEVLARGATPLDTESFRWDILRDPEGGELCVFSPRDEQSEVPSYKLYEIVIDSADPTSIATWWHGVLGGELGGNPEKGWAWLDQVPQVPFENLVFVKVPEPKTVKNRVHWDVDIDDLQALVDHGATVLRERDDQIAWTVMADPEGNEFCAFTPRD